MTPGPGIEPGTHWWEASTLTTAPLLLPKVNKKWVIRNGNKKSGSPSLFSSYKCLNVKLRVFFSGHTVAMVTNCATKLTATYSPMIGQFFDTMISDRTKFMSWKVLKKVLSHLNTERSKGTMKVTGEQMKS